ncbi:MULTISPECIES: GGDEF domain-containing protein [Paenibacillus]|uniref:GGDEF domain-containing protein n=1 Tax=Paenibacillus flagellatus TaxID=2211139 RepID=A0A2V5JW18_9BACL|nr:MULTISPECIES: GGDEF domain-containing protein [Paenibacillus]PYI50955.1 hypothetical protein DLM86_26630 [Paenibacillus flagellatus]
MNKIGRVTAVVFVISLVAILLIYIKLVYDVVDKAVAMSLAVFLPLAYLYGKRFDALLRLSQRDDLTGVYNRGFIQRLFPKLVRRSQRLRKKLLVFYVDVDNFKVINDTYSHETGDRVLCQLSSLLTKTASKYDYVARWGGDEFVVIVPHTDEEGARVLQRRLGSALSISLNELKTHVHLSVGYAVCPDESADLGELLRRADKRMYKQKFSQHND